MKSLFKPIMCLLPCLLPAGAWAAHPLTTEDTGTQGEGNWQLEINADRARARETNHSTLTANATLTRGLGDNIDVGLNLPWQQLQSGDDPRQTDRGPGDVSVFLKWRLYDQGKTSLALKPVLNIPTGDADKGLGADRSQAGITGVAQWGNEIFSVFANAGYLYADNRTGDRKDILNTSGAAAWKFAERFQLVGEIGASSNCDPDAAKWPAFANIGLIYSPTEKIDLDIGYRHGLNKPADLYSYSAGVTLRW